MTTSRQENQLTSEQRNFLDKCRFKYYDLGYDILYALGMSEQRVTLYSQQVRALNLIYCLDQDNKLKKGNKIAVIGGGLSGITAAAAAAVLGINVDLFEQRTSLCHLQNSCKTRWVDPYIYDWPEPGSDNPYAGLPLLTWRSGIAASVIDKICEQFLKDFVKFDYKKTRNITLYLGASAKLIEIENELEVFWDNAIAPLDHNTRHRPDSRGGNKKYDAIILATGFGIEKNVENGLTMSYWRNDTINQPEPGVTSEKPTTFLISGTGDGGLIDLLRVRLHNFNQSSIIDELIMSDDIDNSWVINLLESRNILEVKSREFDEFQQEYKDFYNEDISDELDKEKYKELIQNIAHLYREIKSEGLLNYSSYDRVFQQPDSEFLERIKIDKIFPLIVAKARQEMNLQRKKLIKKLQDIAQEAKEDPKKNEDDRTWLFNQYEKLKTSICEEQQQLYKYTFLDYLDYKIQRKLRDDTTAILNATSPTFALALRLDNASLFNTFITYRLYQLKAFSYISGKCRVKSPNEVLIVNEQYERKHSFDHLIIRHGPNSNQVLINLGLAETTVKEILAHKEPIAAKRLWDSGFYEKKMQELNPDYFDREFVAPLTKVMAEDFLSSLRSRLEELNGSGESQDNGLVLALHRVLKIDGKYYIQHIGVDANPDDSEKLSGIVWRTNKGLAGLSFYQKTALTVAKNGNVDDGRWKEFWNGLKIDTEDLSFRKFESFLTIPFYASSEEQNQNKIALILFISSDKPTLCSDLDCLKIIYSDCKRFVQKVNYRTKKNEIWCISSGLPDIEHNEEEKHDFQKIIDNYEDIVQQIDVQLYLDNLAQLTFDEKIQSFDFVLRE
ncbi:MAG: NAD(P)-binding protein [Crocosphaera sp.]